MLDENDWAKLFIKLLDVAGRTVRQQTLLIKNQQAELDLEGLQRGVYIITATAENGQQFSNKIMIDR